MIASKAYDYLPDMAGSQDKLQSLFDLEADFTFESSEQAWAALLWVLEVEDAQQFLKHWKTSRQFAKQVQDLLTILELREEGELSKRDCYRFDLDLLIQAENLRQAQGKEVNPQAIEETYHSLTIHDEDIATSSYPEETKQIFPRTADIGIEHGTVLVLDGDEEYEVTTFRTEDVYVDYRRPSSVSFVRSLEEDLKRRDFTVNAFALDETGEIVDLFDGLQDLENQVLRAVGVASERFNEDALRIMRGFRFQASLGFELEQETFEAMKTLTALLEKISVERTFVEFDKLLLAPNW